MGETAEEQLSSFQYHAPQIQTFAASSCIPQQGPLVYLCRVLANDTDTVCCVYKAKCTQSTSDCTHQQFTNSKGRPCKKNKWTTLGLLFQLCLMFTVIACENITPLVRLFSVAHCKIQIFFLWLIAKTQLLFWGLDHLQCRIFKIFTTK